MRRRDLRELAIYELESEVDSVQFQSIRSLFVEKTSLESPYKPPFVYMRR